MSDATDTPTDSRARVRKIQAMMLAGEWERGKTGTVLAKEWGVSKSRMRDLAAQASTSLDAIQNRDMIEAISRERLLEIIDSAKPADAVQAIRTILQNIGRLTERHEVEAKVGALDDAKLLTQVDRMLAAPPAQVVELLHKNGWRRRVEVVTEGEAMDDTSTEGAP